ncbi:alpha/beta fold hydrolase [Halobacterium rubrum]|uniref:alpha/beta fold hydrolase n=1 Tax=Halobacterium TaxID=2239 RepID=UPI001F1FD70F|nr:MULTISPECIES: alpha/beta hydrolase [Halobacterium]MDH5018908.1 alpha/beta hydrolase [Halobacterium rubrum]
MPFIETNGIQTYYEREGDGQPLVLVHGATSDHQLWGNQVAALSDDYEVITYDMRGHGRTGDSDLPRYTIDLYADDLRALIDALELESPCVCGLSMGGMTALTYAARYPDELSALIVAGAPTPESQSLKEAILMDGIYPAMTKLTGLIGYDRVQSVMWWVSEKIGDSGEAEEVEAAADELREEDVELESGEYEKIMDAADDYRNAPVRLENITVPTLVLYGETEPLIRNHIPVYRDRVSDVTINEIPDAGHNSHIQNPEAFTSAVREFVQETEARRSVPPHGE